MTSSALDGLIDLWRDAFAQLQRDQAAREWRALRREAALRLLGDDASADAVNALLDELRGGV